MGGKATRSGSRAGGHSLAEVLISLTVFIGILVAVLLVFNLSYRIARDRAAAGARRVALRGAQHDLVRQVRQAGRSGLPHDLAIEVANNVPPGTTIGGPGTPPVVAGTDVLILRGVFSTPLFQVQPATAVAATAVLEIRDRSPQTGAGQSLAELAAAIEAPAPLPDSLLLVSALDESLFAVVETDPAASTVRRDGDSITAIGLAFRAPTDQPELFSAERLAATLRGAAVAGILEEYRFYIRATNAAPGDPASAPRPQLAMARFVPGSDRPYGGDATNLAIDLVGDVADLQVALGIDLDGSGRVDADGAGDEWLFNHPGDDAAAPRWAGRRAALDAVRLTCVAAAGGWRLEAVVDL